MVYRRFMPLAPYFFEAKRAGVDMRPARAPRHPVPPGSLLAQQCQLIFAPPIYASYPCLVTDIANGGYGICLIGLTRLSPDHLAGMDAFLEMPDNLLIAVELRWVRGPKIGLKRLPRGAAK
jgi:hypothetical protein